MTDESAASAAQAHSRCASPEVNSQIAADAGTAVKAAQWATGDSEPETEVRDGASIYYLGVVSADRLETINFDMNIRPEGASRNLQVRYTHQFYTR